MFGRPSEQPNRRARGSTPSFLLARECEAWELGTEIPNASQMGKFLNPEEHDRCKGIRVACLDVRVLACDDFSRGSELREK